ncbi:MAG: response regulator transcription factor [Acidobacteria bacterium]|nr:response regulator transcription factor [Acidobacteriota bacterium]
MEQILVIDDDTELCDLVTEYLEPDGFAVEAINNPEIGLARGLSGEHKLIVLDVMMPGINGFEVLRRLRANSRLPVLMLTARGSDVDRIVGLELGADDYLPKPFNPRELVARIHAILRRTNPIAEPTLSNHRLTIGDVNIDCSARVAHCGGEKIELTSAEFELLIMLLQSAGNVISREEISQNVLGREFNPLDRSIDTHISNLRKKLGFEVNGVERIKSVRGVGYIYAKASEE